MSKKKQEKWRDSPEYLAKCDYFAQFLTIYGKNCVKEALLNPLVEIKILHLANAGSSSSLNDLARLAEIKGVKVDWISRQRVTQISKNGRQDQGVVADIKLSTYLECKEYLREQHLNYLLFAIDGITTPRNLGMIIRSAVAAGVDGIILPKQGCCQINPLVIKSSAGTVFHQRILHCRELLSTLKLAQEAGAKIITLKADAKMSLFDFKPVDKVVYVLGEEAKGVSAPVRKISDFSLSIPMQNGIDSLNVASCATLLAYKRCFEQQGKL